MNSRSKGARGEREAATLFREYGYDVHRTAQRTGVTGTADIEGAPGIHVEVKRRESLNVYDAMAQAVRDHKGNTLPVVMWRKNDCEWLMTMRFEDWMELYRVWEAATADTRDLPFNNRSTDV